MQVAKISFFVTACAAKSKSIGPIILPAFLKFVFIFPYSITSLSLNLSSSKIVKNLRRAALFFSGYKLLETPNSNSATLNVEI